MNFNDACAREQACADYRILYPSPQPMIVNTARLEPDHPLPADIVWSQGPEFNRRLVEEIDRETAGVDLRPTASRSLRGRRARKKGKTGCAGASHHRAGTVHNRTWPDTG